MDVPVGEAEGLLADLIRRAKDGEDIVLTRDGRPVARLVAVAAVQATAAERRAALLRAQDAGRRLATPGPTAARSQDFLYDENGLPV